MPHAPHQLEMRDARCEMPHEIPTASCQHSRRAASALDLCAAASAMHHAMHSSNALITMALKHALKNIIKIITKKNYAALRFARRLMVSSGRPTLTADPPRIDLLGRSNPALMRRCFSTVSV